MHTLVILNPNAGSADQVPRLRRLLAGQPGFEVRETEGPGDAETLAREAVRDGVATVVAAGGDGTLNEVLNGLADDLSAARLGVLPLGTGNDFARTVGVPEETEAALQVLHRGRTRRIDVARCAWGDGELGRPMALQPPRHVLRRRLRQVELADLHLDGDLPRHHRRDQQLDPRVTQDEAGAERETLRLGADPQPAMGVDDEARREALEGRPAHE